MASLEETPVAAETAVPPQTPHRSPFKRLQLFLRLWALKITVSATLSILRFFKLHGMGVLQPTYKKRYPVGANLENHIWIPRSHKSGTTLPLYLDIHGGGFCIGDPTHDAAFCHHLAETHGICVVSLDYRKGPTHSFPQPTQDLVEIVQAVLSDPDLPVDRENVAMGGFSAGGNLSLSVSQRPELRGKIKGLLLWYPVTDFSGRYKGTFKTASDGSPDVLARMSELFNFGYVAPGQDREDPYLSPIYADRETLPRKMFFIGAEHDILCHEAEKTAEMYAAAEGSAGAKTGDVNEWTQGDIRWKRVLDVQHGFNLMRKKEPEAEARRIRITDAVYAEAAEWLKREIYT